MLHKKHQEKTQLTSELRKLITEIPVTNGRDMEPFVKVFNYSDKNIAKSSLGSLVGVFEVADKNEDSVFIVNFLTSVAKTEYFSNLRRGSIESFEAALHKINLALAELVKDGHIAWLGKFHGALGVLEKNNFHFSVTGKAQILLLRNGSLSEISEGLASSESNVHPLKTFVEISSGRLVPDDKIILTSPELFDLLTPEDLEKNAARMDTEQFSQFLRTVLVNKLDMGGSLIVDFQETESLVPRKKEIKKLTIEGEQNFFSQEAFDAAQKQKNAVVVDGLLNDVEVLEREKEEHVDPRTLHIYVQGDDKEQPQGDPFLDKIQLTLQDILYSLGTTFASQKKFLRKSGKKSAVFFAILVERMGTVGKSTAHILHEQWQKGMSAGSSKIAAFLRARAAKKTTEDVSVRIEQKQSFSSDTPLSEPHSERKITPLPHEKEEEELPPFLREKLAAFYRKETKTNTSIFPQMNASRKQQGRLILAAQFVQKIWQKSLSLLSSLVRYIKPRARYFFGISLNFLKNHLSRYEKRTIVIGFLTLSLFLVGTVLTIRSFSREAIVLTAETPETPPLASAFPLDTEKSARLVENIVAVITTPDSIVTSLFLGDEKYIVTPSYILSVSGNKQFPFPSGNGTIRLATSMEDLRIILLYTDKDEIFSFAPSNHSFVKNAIVLPPQTQTKSIGTYLTYLYILDKTTGQVYRFPRAEGGFGAGSVWLKQALTLEDAAQIAVSETIFIAPNKTTVSAFFRGQFVKNLESPLEPLSLTHLFTNPDLANVYALDADKQRIVIWNQDGAIVAQYFSEQFSRAESISVSEKTHEIFLTTSNELLSFTFNLEQ